MWFLKVLKVCQDKAQTFNMVKTKWRIPQFWPWCHVSCINYDSYEACWLYDTYWDARHQCEATGSLMVPVCMQPSVASLEHSVKRGPWNLRWVVIMCLLITTVTLLLNLEIALGPRSQNEVQTSCRLNLGPLVMELCMVGEASYHLFKFKKACSIKLH